MVQDRGIVAMED